MKNKKPKEALFVENPGRFIPSYPPAIISGYIEKLERPAYSDAPRERLVVTGPKEFITSWPYVSADRFEQISYEAGPPRMLEQDGRSKRMLDKIRKTYKL